MPEVWVIYKIGHVVSVFAWMAGLFYLPRLFVYHAKVARGSESDALFQMMERRLLKAIMAPAAVASWFFGILTAWEMGWLTSVTIWFWVKVLLVGALSLFHVFLIGCHNGFAAGRNRRSEKFYRIINEVPTVILILVVVLVVAKPFA